MASALFDDVIFVKDKSPITPSVSRRVRWRAPVIQVTGRLRLADRLSSGALSCSGLCRSGVRTKFGIDMVLLGEPGTTRSSKEGCTGPGRKRSRSKPPCRSVVGSRP
ncbi:homeodomain-interacting protein kinase 3-like protein [Lates japonicus]|uniref:Homeodomain-interacting protein kinase 3-like protein n=1 Tax=Lates japonicus TaxID=270547 RepID=A0AAD3MM95_LATJO|nr:homeodomain-interacting protein kinase 3-like protein [Lates japonicus]